MKDYMVDHLNRIISLINNIDKVVEDTDLEVADRFQLVYTSVQLIKGATQDLVADSIHYEEEENKIGFKADKGDN